MQATLEKFKKHMKRIRDLQAMQFLARWDQNVMMPEGGASDRGELFATLGALVHEMQTDPALADMLDELTPYAESLDYDSLDASLVRHTRHKVDTATRLPADLVEAIEHLRPTAMQAWKQARAQDDFTIFQPKLEEMVSLTRERGHHLSDTDNPYDGLLNYYEPGLDYKSIKAIFDGIRPGLLELTRAIAQNQDAVDGSLARRPVSEDQQLALVREVTARIGYDYDRGRLDLTAHPFAWGTGPGDSRITTRISASAPLWSLKAAIHESGHAMNLQRMDRDVAMTPMAYIPKSVGISESQSRFCENMVGRSLPFWRHFYPRLQAVFAPAYDDVSLDDFYKAFNEVKPGLIRVDADEVTYGLHIMLRFEIENDLLNGRLEVADLPEAWNARMEEFLGVVPPSDADGVLQDVHWAASMIGGFHGYLLGSMFAAQLWDAMLIDIPDADDQMEEGRFEAIIGWTADKVMRHGDKFTFPESVERATGKPLDSTIYLRYLTGKFSAIYNL